MRVGPRLLLIGLAGLSGGLLACYTGEGLLGAVCQSDDQCGLGQKCVTQICGACKDGFVDPGEVCLGIASEDLVYGTVTGLFAFDPDGDDDPTLVAMVNTNCQEPPHAGPPGLGDACYEAFRFENDADGDFEAVRVVFDQDDPDADLKGRVPEATTGEFNGSGTLDIAFIVLPNSDSMDLPALHVAHDFNPAVTPSPDVFPIAFIPSTLLAADIDGDGIDDVIMSGQRPAGMDMEGNLVFESVLVQRISTAGVGFADDHELEIPDGYDVQPTALVDMNNDGAVDLPVIVSSKQPGVEGEIAIYLNDGDGDFELGTRVVVEGPGSPLDLATADFDRDGNMDIVAVASDIPAANPRGLLYHGDGSGSLGPQTEIYAGELPWSVITADVNHDEWPDIIIADLNEDKLPLHINREGSFPDHVTIDVAAAPIQIMFADFNHDELDDVVVANANGVVAVVPGEN